MSEEKKGLVKITIEIELNKAMMEASKEWMATMAAMRAKWMKGHGWKKGEWKKGEEEEGESEETKE
jgi:hypothetical protein